MKKIKIVVEYVVSTSGVLYERNSHYLSIEDTFASDYIYNSKFYYNSVTDKEMNNINLKILEAKAIVANQSK